MVQNSKLEAIRFLCRPFDFPPNFCSRDSGLKNHVPGNPGNPGISAIFSNLLTYNEAAAVLKEASPSFC